MKKILIIREGRWGTVQPQEYQSLIDAYVRILSEAEKEFSSPTGNKGDKLATVEVIDTADIAESIIRRERIDVVIFISRDMAYQAEVFAEMFPKTRVMVFTGLIPECKVIWVEKILISDPQILKQIVFSH